MCCDNLTLFLLVIISLFYSSFFWLLLSVYFPLEIFALEEELDLICRHLAEPCSAITPWNKKYTSGEKQQIISSASG